MPPRNLLAILLTIVFSLACYSVAAKNRYSNLLAEAMDVVHEKALRPVKSEDLFVGAMNGMLKDLDEHSIYISGANYKSFDEDLRQEFGGVGMYVEVDPKSKMLMVLAPMPNTPAYEAGMQVGDLIVSIGGEPTYGKQRTEAVKSLKGPIGESVELEVQRGDQTFKKTLVRGKIPVESVHGDYRQPDGTWEFRLKAHPEIGYVRLSQFGEKSATEVRNALTELSKDSQISGVILDLRANSGGLLNVAVDICDFFIEPGKTIVKIRGRDRVLKDEYDSSTRPVLDSSIPVCVLIDRFSASASEIVAACLQDHGRAVMIGEQTYGKGTVQDIIPIEQGKSILKLTTASYWRPSGKNIDRNDEVLKEKKAWGVQPNEGFEIEMTLDDIMRNLKSRNARDIEGLSEGAEELLSEVRNPQNQTDAADPIQDPSDRKKEPTTESTIPMPDEDPKASPITKADASGEVSSSEEKAFADLPLEKAIDYLKGNLKPAQDASHGK